MSTAYCSLSIRLICTDHIREVWTKDKWLLISSLSCQSASRASITVVDCHAPSKRQAKDVYLEMRSLILINAVERVPQDSRCEAHRKPKILNSVYMSLPTLLLLLSSFRAPPTLGNQQVPCRNGHMESNPQFVHTPSVVPRKLMVGGLVWQLALCSKSSSWNGNEPFSSHPSLFLA